MDCEKIRIGRSEERVIGTHCKFQSLGIGMRLMSRFYLYLRKPCQIRDTEREVWRSRVKVVEGFSLSIHLQFPLCPSFSSSFPLLNLSLV